MVFIMWVKIRRAKNRAADAEAYIKQKEVGVNSCEGDKPQGSNGSATSEDSRNGSVSDRKIGPWLWERMLHGHSPYKVLLTYG